MGLYSEALGTTQQNTITTLLLFIQLTLPSGQAGRPEDEFAIGGRVRNQRPERYEMGGVRHLPPWGPIHPQPEARQAMRQWLKEEVTSWFLMV